MPGLCRAATLKEIEAQGWSLNPGRYVGVAPGEAVSDEDFKEQLETLNEELETLNAQARELEATIASQRRRNPGNMSPPRKSAAIVHQPVAQFYDRFVAAIKERIRTAQIQAALAANAELILLYWDIGREILANQKREGWGAKVVARLAADLQREIPNSARLLRP